MTKETLFALAVLAGLPLAADRANADNPRTVRGILAEHCIECHRIPGFAEAARSPEIGAPDFQAMADDRKIYTSERLAKFMAQPHFPMRRVLLSSSDIQRIISFIESLRGRPEAN